jgi:hypothetical protein
MRPRSDAEEANVPVIAKATPTANPTDAITLNDLSLIVPPSHSTSRAPPIGPEVTTLRASSGPIVPSAKSQELPAVLVLGPSCI